MYELQQVSIAGAPGQMGCQLGEECRELVHSLVSNRLDEVNGYFAERGYGSVARLEEIGRDSLALLSSWDPAGYEEHAGVARGADVDPARLLALLNMTDTRDLVSSEGGHAPAGDDEGCTALGIPAGLSTDGHVIMAQSWDLNIGDLQHVIAVHRRPDDGPETWSVTVAGGPTLIGMNEHGVWVGTTNLKTSEVRLGIGYMNLLHRAIQERGRVEAARVIEQADRMAAHTYWLADSGGAIELECSATMFIQRDLDDEPLVQTNHCLDPGHQAIESEVPSESSVHRCKRAGQLLEGGAHDLDAIRLVLSDRSDGVLSISRHPEDGEPTSTNACAIGIPAERIFEACRGPAEQGRWVRLAFD